MMAPDEVDMEHEVVKCGMCIVKEMNVVKGEKELLRKAPNDTTYTTYTRWSCHSGLVNPV